MCRVGLKKIRNYNRKKQKMSLLQLKNRKKEVVVYKEEWLVLLISNQRMIKAWILLEFILIVKKKIERVANQVKELKPLKQRNQREL